ncbi:fibrinolytic enzyme, isozyme C-like isoform X2 [Argopecten irradians]|uniref:fibrinolytic enzyme, isozyme C-like isoform X2 n=1 Tax=Argopecten irradians TaxID=31199 RepID=UPI00370FD97C
MTSIWLLILVISGCLALPEIPTVKHPNQDLIDQAEQVPSIEHPNQQLIDQAVQRLANVQGRIIQGSDTTIDRYPWQASLEYNGNHICGAVILTNDFVLTAAHCVQNTISDYVVHVGSASRTASGGSRHNVQQGKLHEDFYNGASPSNGAFPYDIAVLLLRDPITYNSNKQPIGLTAVTNSVLATYDSSDCVITGWGRNENNVLPDILQMTNVKVLTDNTCRVFAGNYLRDNLHICVDGVDESGGCNGDSGGPLACKVGNNYELAGVTSFVFGQCLTSSPTVYAETYGLREWIATAMDNLSL